MMVKSNRYTTDILVHKRVRYSTFGFECFFECLNELEKKQRRV